MLIRAKRGLVPVGGTGLVEAKLVGGKFHFLHAQDVEPVARACQERRKDRARGYNKTRTMQLVASIPELVFYAHPEFVEGGQVNRKALNRFLQGPEGAMYRTTEGAL